MTKDSDKMMPTLNMDEYEPEGLEAHQEEFKKQFTPKNGTVQARGDTDSA